MRGLFPRIKYVKSTVLLKALHIKQVNWYHWNRFKFAKYTLVSILYKHLIHLQTEINQTDSKYKSWVILVKFYPFFDITYFGTGNFALYNPNFLLLNKLYFCERKNGAKKIAWNRHACLNDINTFKGGGILHVPLNCNSQQSVATKNFFLFYYYLWATWIKQFIYFQIISSVNSS